MTTQADVKLVIDQLDQLDFGSINDKYVVGNAVEMLETLSGQVAKLEAVLREVRDDLTEESTFSHDKIYEALQTIYKVLK